MAATINVESHDKLTAPATINPLKKNDYIKRTDSSTSSTSSWDLLANVSALIKVATTVGNLP